jgi:hypothetical protein
VGNCLADTLPRGAWEPDCLRLAAFHSTAVDFPKTGIPAVLPLDLKVAEYPDFMEKKDKSSVEARVGRRATFLPAHRYLSLSPVILSLSLSLFPLSLSLCVCVCVCVRARAHACGGAPASVHGSIARPY